MIEAGNFDVFLEILNNVKGNYIIAIVMQFPRLAARAYNCKQFFLE